MFPQLNSGKRRSSFSRLLESSSDSLFVLSSIPCFCDVFVLMFSEHGRLPARILELHFSRRTVIKVGIVHSSRQHLGDNNITVNTKNKL